jgi:STAS domain
MMLTLPDKPLARELPAFRQALLDQLTTPDGIRLDAAEVNSLPLPWMQVLIAASLEARGLGQAMTVFNPSFAFLFSFEALGLQPAPDLFNLEYA